MFFLNPVYNAACLLRSLCSKNHIMQEKVRKKQLVEKSAKSSTFLQNLINTKLRNIDLVTDTLINNILVETCWSDATTDKIKFLKLQIFINIFPCQNLEIFEFALL